VTGAPTYAIPSTFLGTERRDSASRYCVAGIPFDIGTTNRSGARFGPAAIRAASRMLVDGAHPQFWNEPAGMDLADIGEFATALGDIPASMALIETQAQRIGHLIALGGDHSVTLPLLRAAARRPGPPALVHFDAHVDTWPDSFGQPLGHGSVFYHAIEEELVQPRRMIQIGIRSPMPREIHDWTLGRGVTIVPALEAHEMGPAAVAARIEATVGDAPVYLSFDIDVLDPAFAPGTGTPEIGGLATWQVQAILRRLGKLSFIGMDVVEVAPAYDVAEITALAGATVAWEYLCLVEGGRLARTSSIPLSPASRERRRL
jgi:agmatinase